MPDNEKQDNNNAQSNYLGIMFNCCGIYGRIYKNRDKTAYVGRCPKCMRNIRIPIGGNGTNTRFFNAY